MNRRDLISAASAGVVLSAIEARATRVKHDLLPDPDPICALPFVRDTTPAERAAGAPPRLFWSVQPSGDRFEEARQGEAYARAAMDYINAHRSPFLLGWCVSDMMRLHRSFSGIELAFLRTFGAYGASSHWLLQRTEEDPTLLRESSAS